MVEGAVESIVWDYYENLLRRNIDVKIVNRANPNDIIHEINTLSPKIVHIMYDDHIVIAPYINCKKYIIPLIMRILLILILKYNHADISTIYF